MFELIFKGSKYVHLHLIYSVLQWEQKGMNCLNMTSL